MEKLTNKEEQIMHILWNLNKAFVKDKEMMDFFTFRRPMPDYWLGPDGPDQWSWLEVYPQHVFRNSKGEAEQMSVGVAQNALELALGYACDRAQFDRPIRGFARVGGKLGWMAVETMIARQLAYFAARQRDAGQRCDIEAGMAKLLGARVAWSNADNGVQIHGGNGYAEEFVMSRVLCDARILNIFEGAAEIQAGIIARGLLSRPNRPAA